MSYAITPKQGGRVQATFDYLEDAVSYALPHECIIEGAYWPDDYVDKTTIGLQRITGFGLVLDDDLAGPWES